MPTAVCPAATGLLTTADAATTAPSLISMFPSTLEPAHMSTSFPTFGCRSWSGDVPVAPSVTSCMIVEEQLLEADLLVRVVRRELRAELVRERLGERPVRQHLAEEEAIHAEASVRGRRQRRARFVLELGPGRGGHHTGL